MLRSVLTRHWIPGRILAFEELIAQRRKDSVAAAVTVPAKGYGEGRLSVH